MKQRVYNYGFLPPPITPDQYTFAGQQLAGLKVKNPTRDWTASLPQKELQHNDLYDTNACYIYGSLNIIETLIKYDTGIDFNFSERFIAHFTNHTPYGGNPHEALEAVRKKGLIPDDMLPLGEVASFDEYVGIELTTKQIKEGLKWLERHTIKHDWLILPDSSKKDDKIHIGLGTSPIGVSVVAWKMDGKLYVKEKGEADTHWCLVYAIDKQGNYLVFDTYDGTHKVLKKGYDFGYAKRVYVLDVPPPTDNWLIQFLKKLLRR